MAAKSDASPGNSSLPARQEWPSRSSLVMPCAMKSKARLAIVEPGRLAEHDAGIDQRRDHQSVPVGQHLVVEAGPHAARARREQFRAQRRPAALHPRRCAAPSCETIEDIVAFEIAAGADVVMRSKECGIFGAEHLFDLRLRPDVELALLAFRVGIERSGEGALRRGHLAREPGDGLARAGGEQRIARALMRQRQQFQKLGVVVEHLLEMRHQPALVDRIARKAAAEMIVDAALAHASRASARPCRRSAHRRVRKPARQSISRIEDCGNFGAPRKPPWIGSKALPIGGRRCRAPSARW